MAGALDFPFRKRSAAQHLPERLRNIRLKKPLQAQLCRAYLPHLIF